MVKLKTESIYRKLETKGFWFVYDSPGDYALVSKSKKDIPMKARNKPTTRSASERTDQLHSRSL